jgi:hypothetical protein
VIVYLAGSSRDLTRVRLMANRITDAGMAIAHHWFDSTTLGHDAALTREQQEAIAGECRHAISAADVFWLLVPGHALPPSSSLIEFGYAEAAAVPTIVTGGAANALALLAMADYRDSSDECGFAELVNTAKRWGAP